MSEPLHTDRKIIHVDMDAFYASVEQRDHPEWRGKPIAVGGGSRRGVITTASYEARKFGVRSAMPGFKAKELCPELIFVPIRFDVYRQVSGEIREIFSRYTDLIEPLSFDEAFLDITENKVGLELGMEVARMIKNDIQKELQLTASAGVSYCKFIAKIASDMNKPDGLTVIHPSRAIEFLEKLPVEKFFGVGKVTARRMNALGIYTGADLKTWTLLDLIEKFGKTGRFFYDIVRGIDNRLVKPNRMRKSLAVERTLHENLEDLQALQAKLDEVLGKLEERLVKSQSWGRTVTLKLKTSAFQILTRSHTEDVVIRDIIEIRRIAHQLLEQHQRSSVSIRLIGDTYSNQ
ncbi:MAG: DNA polymerase IV, partial [Bacteroidota bacterium]